jgi:hypothetical protein
MRHAVVSHTINPQEMCDPIVEATLDVYKKVMASLLPTPTKSHYTFNLRDISRVMQVQQLNYQSSELAWCYTVQCIMWCSLSAIIA